MSSLLTVLAIAALAAQGRDASLAGVVRDAESGEPVAGAVVALTDLDRTTASGPDGRYRFHAVPAGPQHVEVRRLGYQTRALHALVPAGGELEINFSLRPVAVPLARLDVTLPVAVRGAEPGAGADAHPAVTLSAAAVRNHPLLAEPDFLGALAGGAVAAQPESPHGLHVRGGGADQVTYLLDGVPVLSPYHATGLFSAWNPDALARLRLETTPPAAAAPDALSGVVAAETRRPGTTVRIHGALSSTQARVTVDGPLGPRAGFLASGRRGFPGVPNPVDEPSYVHGGSGDWLAKVEGAVAGGDARLLGYGNRNWTGAARQPEPPAGPDGDGARNRFTWDGLSLGGEWARGLGAGRVRARAWAASAEADAAWAGDDPAAARLASSRGDLGGSLSWEAGDSAARTLVGVRAHRSRTDYRVDSAGGAAAYRLEGETQVAAVFARHARALGERFGLDVGAAGASYAGRLRLAPQVQLRWSPSEALTLLAGASRSFQAEQSLGNPESVVGQIFPAALWAGAGVEGVPLARSDQAFVAAAVHPRPGVRVAAQAYARDFAGLVLVAPSTGEPFATGGATVGSGRSHGGAVDVAVSGARHAFVGSWGFQRVRLAWGDSAYVPAYAALHTADAGVVFFPQASLSLRVGLSGALGRRTSALLGGFEWEACNLLDRGCEFGGTPRTRPDRLGRTRLPGYLRVDLGARKHWHLRVGGREAVLGVYASVTNVLGRQNLLTFSVDPATGERTGIEMTSRVPLVAGIDWRF